MVVIVCLLTVIWFQVFLSNTISFQTTSICSTFSFPSKGIILRIELPENPANTYAQHTETLDSCFDLIKSPLWTRCWTLFAIANQTFVSAELHTSILKRFYAFVNQFPPLTSIWSHFSHWSTDCPNYSGNILLCPKISSPVLMHFSFLPTFHRRIIAFAMHFSFLPTFHRRIIALAMHFSFLPTFHRRIIAFAMHFSFLPTFHRRIIAFAMHFSFLPTFHRRIIAFAMRFSFLPTFHRWTIALAMHFSFLPTFHRRTIALPMHFSFFPTFHRRIIALAMHFSFLPTFHRRTIARHTAVLCRYGV